MGGYTAILRGFTQAAIASADNGSGFAVLVIGDSTLHGGSTGVLATMTLQKPSFTFASGLATMAGAPLTATVTGNGTAALAELRDSNGVAVVSALTVGVAGGFDVDLSTTTLTSGEIVTMNDGTLLLAP